MFTVFLNVILPIFVVAAAGALIQRLRKLPIGPLSPVTLYILSPALIFQAMVQAEVPSGVSGRVLLSAVLFTIASGGAAIALSLLLRHSRPLQAGFLLATMFPNAANMALPITFLAFGEDGLAIAVIMFVYQALIGWSLGVFIAARSNSQGLAPLASVLKVPAMYAVGLALLVRVTGWDLPTPVAEPVRLLAGAAIPMMLLVLGFQFSQGFDFSRWMSIATALVLRLIAPAGIAYGITEMVGLDGVAQKTVILVVSMPAAVFTTLLATEFRSEPRFVTSTVTLGTLLSLGTLTVLITILDRIVG
jgi:predicted permease